MTCKVPAQIDIAGNEREDEATKQRKKWYFDTTYRLQFKYSKSEKYQMPGKMGELPK